MVRHFPRAPERGVTLDEELPDARGSTVSALARRAFGRTRRRPLLLGVVVALVTSAAIGSGIPLAQAGPDDDKRRVERQIEGAKEDLDESSAALQKASSALASAEAKLAEARRHLATVRGKLTAAKARDRAMAAKLAAARRAVAKAKAALAAAEQQVDDQRGEIADFANASYQQAGIGELAALVQSETPDDLLSRMQIVSSVSQSQSSMLDRLNAARASVASKKAALEIAEKLAADQRREAAENLATMRRLEREAAAAETAVEGLVADRAAARRAADEAKQDDLRHYRELVAERERIERKLREIARREAEERRRERERDRGGSGGGGDTGGGDTGGGGSSSGLSWPVSAPITSPYGMRFHPVLRVWKLHDGTDFGAGCGTPVRAAASGTVVERYYNGGYGNRVIIAHGWMSGASIATSYNHLSAFAVGAGQWVGRGEIIGYVGTTGYSTGCHLHFMVYRNGATVDPMGYL